MEDFCLAVIDALYSRGARMVFLLNGHGGNCSFLMNGVKYAGERHPDMFSATTWLTLSCPQGMEALEKHRRTLRGGMGHAFELENALMMAFRPVLVDMDRVVDEIDFVNTPSYYMDWVEGGALIANPPWLDDTTSGAYSPGSLATVSNGRIWLDTAAQKKSDPNWRDH